MEQIERIEKLLAALQARVDSKPGIPKLAAAYVKARRKITHTVKNANNPHFGSNYATLDAVLDSFTDAFADEGIALLQAPGPMDGDKISVQGLLIHESGETISFNTQVPLGAKATAQAAGSAITYARRYQAAAVAGIAQVDDDGNEASQREETTARKRAANSNAPDVTSVLADIEGMTDATMEAVKAKVQALGDNKVAEKFLAKKKELRGAGKKAA